MAHRRIENPRPSPSPRRRRQRVPRKHVDAALAGQGILIPHAQDIGAYLDSHLDLARLVPSLCAQARREFGTDAELILKVYRDPEINDQYLSLEVRLPSYDETIMDRIESVTQPFHEQLCQLSGFFLVNTFFRRPRANHAV